MYKYHKYDDDDDIRCRAVEKGRGGEGAFLEKLSKNLHYKLQRGSQL